MRELLDYRSEFPILEHTTYLINLSLGAMPAQAEAGMAEYARMWRERGIRAWGEGWWELPLTVGDQVGRIVGAPAGSTAMQIATPREHERRGGTVTVHVEEFPAVHQELSERRILCDFRPGAGIRIGPHYFTSDAELEHAIAQIAEIVETGAFERHLGVAARH